MAVFRTWIYGTIFGQMTCNVLHWYRPDAVQSHMAHLADRINQQWLVYAKSASYSQQTWNKIHVTSPDNPNWGYIDFPLAVTGTNGSQNATTPILCFVLWFKTSTAGRSGLGKYYQSGVNSPQMDQGNWNASRMTVLNSLTATLKSKWVPPGNSELYQLVVAPRDDPASWKAVTDIVARPLVGVQRRRNLGAGA